MDVMRIEEFDDGVAICGNSTSSGVINEISLRTGAQGSLKLVVTDPPYGNIVKETWDRWNDTQASFVDWMLNWTTLYSNLLASGGAMYIWGGYGVPNFRPFFEYITRVESETNFKISNMITWSKRRAYGVQHNYLSTREELLYLVKGNIKRPLTFNVPLLQTKRGYAGYNAKYPAKSEYYRRTNVWSDVTELFRGKVHPTQKPMRVFEIPIEVSSNPSDWVVDPFAGSMTTAHAARKLGRKWICVEYDPGIFDDAVLRLRSDRRKR